MAENNWKKIEMSSRNVSKEEKMRNILWRRNLSKIWDSHQKTPWKLNQRYLKQWLESSKDIKMQFNTEFMNKFHEE